MRRQIPQLLISDAKGKICNLPRLEATGMRGGHFFRLSPKELVKLPPGSELFMLPDRMPVGFDPQTKRFMTLDRNPLSKEKEKCFAVAAFVTPGFTVSHSSSYVEIGRPEMLPLFSYAAAAFYREEFYVTSVRVDRELRQDLRFMDIDRVRENALKLRKAFSHNRLLRHLEDCALIYGCPAAKNLFLGRYEAPLPTSPFCNARCIGCISYQPRKRCHVTQPRIKFVPTPQEVRDIALFHIGNVKDPVVSFGQGCEGEPLLVGDVLEESIRLIRKRTGKGVININTNASRPRIVARLLDAGLDSMRVSLNSAREDFYASYFKPSTYTFKDVIKSIKIARKEGAFVSINYLTVPGFSDSQDEFLAFKDFIETHRINMVQWRNLNFDPARYFRDLRISVDRCELLGIREVIRSLRKRFPGLMMGYFNPARLRMRRHLVRK